MLRLIASLFITVSGFLCGEYFAERARIRKCQLKELVTMLGHMEIWLTSYGMSTEELFMEIYRKGGNYGRLFSVKSNHFTDDISSDIRTSSLEMKDKLADYIAGFGKTDLKGQLSLHRLFSYEVDTEYKNAAASYDRYAKLYRVGGLSVGIMAALLLL
ncbi:stage III sporulation protein AB [Ruminococcus sp.]|uniref:stage III sporulation protein AB n=1 Tax=Ruminococcus sp. TaxID=41978 RepID=UPI0025CEC272|nr:stage III sporulation protein AB [Ruminococcus sp.]MBQ8965251.1 stage III sporulation protein AB [Ruminococcus sp.]